MLRQTLRWGTLALVVGITACTGSLRYKVEPATIADLPRSEKQNLASWQSDRERAQSEKDKAQIDLKAARRALDDAQLESLAARLGSQKLLTELDQEKSRQHEALPARLQAELRVAKLAEDAAEAHLRWCNQGRATSEAQLAVAGPHLQLAEARIEQEQARLAARYGRLPPLPVATFDEQVTQAEAQHTRRRQEISQQATLSSRIEREYNQKLSLYTQARLQTPSFTPFPLALSSDQPLPMPE